MKAKLIYDLPEEGEDFEKAANGWKYSLAIWDLDQKLREMYKYQDIEKIDIDEVRNMIRRCLDEYNLTIE